MSTFLPQAEHLKPVSYILSLSMNLFRQSDSLTLPTYLTALRGISTLRSMKLSKARS